MKPGDMIEIAIWLAGTETPEQIERWKTIECAALVRNAQEQHQVEVGPLTFAVKRPGQERVPPVPDHITGPDVQLLIGEAKVAKAKPRIVQESGFVADLPKDDRARLRTITRRAHHARNPGDHLSNRHCDQIIEALGPDVAVKTLRDGAALH